MVSSSLSPPSFHPTLTVPVPHSFLQAASSSNAHCKPYLLLSLPPALFLDPWQDPIQALLLQSSTPTQRAARGDRHGDGDGATDDLLIEHVDFLSAIYPSQVELERPVGWLGGSYSGVATWKGKGKTGHQGKTEEITKLKMDDNRSSKPIKANRERESILFQLATTSSSSSSSSSSEDRTSRLDIPLHARYLPPVESSSSSLISHILSPTEVGNYFEVAIEGLELFLACQGPHFAELVQEGEEESWKRIPRPSSLLPSTHSHLTSSLLSSLPSKSTIFKRLPPKGDLQPDETELPSLLLPCGDASLAQWTWKVTHAVVWIVALWILTRASRID